MIAQQHKDDNKNFRFSNQVELTSKLVSIIAPTLTEFEGLVLRNVFIGGKSFAQTGKERQLTSHRVKQIAEKALRRVGVFLDNFQQTKEKYLSVVEDYEKLQKKLAKYEKQNDEEVDKDNVIKLLPEKTQKLLKMKIIDTDLPQRAKSVCIRGDVWGTKVEKVIDLVRLSQFEILKFRNCGKKTITMIEDYFEKNDLHWNMSV